MRKLQACLTALAIVAMPGAALADAAGSALGVNPAAAAALAGDTRTLVVGSDVFIGDLIETGPKGQVQILFADNTELVVGPSSALTIEDYLIRNDGSAGKLAVDMLSGAFRFATGDSAKNRYTIGTPTGTIGVRGTEFDVRVYKEGKARVLLYHGAVEFCTFEGDCDVLQNFCDLGELTVSATEVLGNTQSIKGELREDLQADFIYAMNQGPLLPKFWFKTARDCLNKPPKDAPEPLFPDTPDPGSPDPIKPEPPPDDDPCTRNIC